MKQMHFKMVVDYVSLCAEHIRVLEAEGEDISLTDAMRLKSIKRNAQYIVSDIDTILSKPNNIGE